MRMLSESSTNWILILLHLRCSLCHIESWAVDLALDAVARFGLRDQRCILPKAFFDDFVGACPFLT